MKAYKLHVNETCSLLYYSCIIYNGTVHEALSLSVLKSKISVVDRTQSKWEEIISLQFIPADFSVCYIVSLIGMEMTLVKVSCCAQHFSFIILKACNKVCREILMMNAKICHCTVHFHI